MERQEYNEAIGTFVLILIALFFTAAMYLLPQPNYEAFYSVGSTFSDRFFVFCHDLSSLLALFFMLCAITPAKYQEQS